MDEYSILRKECHSYIDGMTETKRDREEIYRWLARKMQIRQKYCHFSMMSISQLYKARKILRNRWLKERKIYVDDGRRDSS